MFKNVSVFKITLPQPVLEATLEDAAQEHQFTPCGPTQERSVGWVPPRGQEHGAMVESIGGHLIMKLMIETRIVPGAAVKRAVEEAAKNIEATAGRKPGKKERSEIRDNVLLELLPMAFTKESSVLVWIDPQARLLVLNAGSQGRADTVMTCLMEAVPGLTVELLQTTVSPTAAMSDWLISHEAPAGFSIERECELKSTDENKATVKYAKHPLDIDEIRQHIETGKVPTKLAMGWEGRVSFLMTDSLQLKKLNFLEGVFENTSTEKEDKFDADMAITTGELSKLIPDLVEALGGEVEGV